MRLAHTLISVALLLLAWSATAGIPRTEAQRTIDGICAREPLRSSLVGVLAIGPGGDTLVSVNPGRKLVPASNVKLLTTGMALHALGADYRFATRLACTGEIVDGTLTGDLYIVGGGDPTTGARTDSAAPLSRTFGEWAAILAEAGITRIAGRVLGDPRFFGDPTPQNLGWTFDDLGTNYGTGPQGLNFFENAQNFYVTPGRAGEKPNYRVQYPDTPWMRYANHAVTGAARSANTLYYVNSTLAPFGEIAGSFPVDRRGYTLECSNAFAPYTCAWYFRNYLESKGVRVDGGWGDVTVQGEIRTDLTPVIPHTPAAAPGELRLLGTAWSVPLSEIVTEANVQSDNFYAETLLRMIALQAGCSTDQDGCRDAAEATLRSLGLRTDNACQQFDGSGLSRKNYVSPAFFVRFLRKMATLPVWDAFLASLPVSGGEGTLEFFLREAPQELKDRIHMKSGSMNGVRCYSGYILPADGDAARAVTFSLMVNNCTASTYVVTPVLEEIIAAIAAEN
ncbi:MAG: D-alanyl-D-alanine carboxypeptidase/D-alanyl-D-alanine-endopeptidase [Bacteroidales bacterium]|nr:D-alanyl-D-alanine carboxypeptidase/D-alanyl-D-alanine-endopeptidase [Bacteroidales bacterium]